jgi:hypothetical protein
MENLPICARCKLRPVRTRRSAKRNRLYVGKFCVICTENQHSVRCHNYNQRRRKHAKENNLCAHCWHNPAIIGLRYCLDCQRNDSVKAKEYNTRNRQLCLDRYGRKCSCKGCDVTLEGFLTIHHVGGWGRDHKMPSGIRRAGASLYRWLVANDFPPGFATLCYNCNCAQEYVGYCPHELQPPQQEFSSLFPLEWQERIIQGFTHVN